MPLSWNEIKTRAVTFTNEWKDEVSEDAEAKSFWDDFFNVFGISRRRVATFEQKVSLTPTLSTGGEGAVERISPLSTLDKAVDLCYRPQPFINKTKRIEFFFELYDRYTGGMFVKEKKKKK